MNLFKKRIGLARAQFRGWSLYGAPWLQTVAIVGKSKSRRSRRNKRKPLRPVATRCLRRSMVSRASAVSCHPLREVPSLRGRGSTRIRDGWLFVTAAVPGKGKGRNRSRCMPRGSCRDSIAAPALVEITAATTVIRNPTDLEDQGRAKADATEAATPAVQPVLSLTVFLGSCARVYQTVPWFTS
jgi:hypothetical protein